MLKFTIFTPAFNRAKYLRRCYESILAQNSESIEWIIIDDGSTDNTNELVQSLSINSKILIRYYYQENAGKQAAWNNALMKANGKYFIGVDSDDTLMDSALSNIEKYLEQLDVNNKIIGLRCLSQNKMHVGNDRKSFSSKNNCENSWFYEFASGIYEERIDVFKTQLLKDFKYPVNAEIKFIPEIWFYTEVSKKYNFFYLNEMVGCYYDDDNENRLSRSSLKIHCRGHFMARRNMLKNIPLRIFLKNPIALIKTIVRLMQSRYYIFLDNK